MQAYFDGQKLNPYFLFYKISVYFSVWVISKALIIL